MTINVTNFWSLIAVEVCRCWETIYHKCCTNKSVVRIGPLFRGLVVPSPPTCSVLGQVIGPCNAPSCNIKTDKKTKTLGSFFKIKNPALSFLILTNPASDFHSHPFDGICVMKTNP